jgi:hypothetical protein
MPRRAASGLTTAVKSMRMRAAMAAGGLVVLATVVGAGHKF